jgi:uncharacterized protein (TIGR02246 family)
MTRFKRMGLTGYTSAAVFFLALVAWPQTAGSKELGCATVTEAEIGNLFVRWNDAVKTGKPENVVALYASDAILLPTVANGPLIGPEPITGYFEHFLLDRPSGEIDQRTIHIGCNVAFDAGLYTFTYNPPPPRPAKEPTKARYTYIYEYDGGRWLIVHHHSSVRPVK